MKTANVIVSDRLFIYKGNMTDTDDDDDNRFFIQRSEISPYTVQKRWYILISSFQLKNSIMKTVYEYESRKKNQIWFLLKFFNTSWYHINLERSLIICDE